MIEFSDGRFLFPFFFWTYFTNILLVTGNFVQPVSIPARILLKAFLLSLKFPTILNSTNLAIRTKESIIIFKYREKRYERIVLLNPSRNLNNQKNNRKESLKTNQKL